MCFSPEASFTAGACLVAAGGITLWRTSRPADLPFAAIPLLFGIQQVTEGFVWRSVLANPMGEHAASGPAIASLYMFFAYLLWPTLLPIAVARAEPAGRRRRWIWALLVPGVATTLMLTVGMIRQTPRVHVSGHHLVYATGASIDNAVITAYIIATCGACLLSSWPWIRVLGVATFIAAAVTAWVAITAFASVWCFSAAILSIIIFAHVTRVTNAVEPATIET